jgi:hypothetical protein
VNREPGTLNQQVPLHSFFLVLKLKISSSAILPRVKFFDTGGVNHSTQAVSCTVRLWIDLTIWDERKIQAIAAKSLGLGSSSGSPGETQGSIPQAGYEN